MVAVVTLLVGLLLSLMAVRVATIALTLTGVSKPLAQFQARSAFTGCGFATSESEQVVNHPVRRQIVMTLMFVGPAGIVTTAGAVVAGLVSAEGGGLPLWERVLFLALGLGVLWVLANSRLVDRAMGRWVKWALGRYTTLDVSDYANLLHISGDYGLGELAVGEGHWLAGKSLAELKLPYEGVLILGVEREGVGYIGAPRSHLVVRPGDTLILYARGRAIGDLGHRRADIAGALARADAVAEHQARSAEETQEAEAIAEAQEALDAAKTLRRQHRRAGELAAGEAD